MRELRTAVMIRVEASWADSNGALRTAIARMEDKSLSGACIRLNLPIQVETKLWVQWRFEELSGIVKYCRSEGAEYVVGIRRDKDHRPFPGRATKIEVTPRPAVKTDEGAVSAQRIHSEVQRMPESLGKSRRPNPSVLLDPKRGQSERIAVSASSGSLLRSGSENRVVFSSRSKPHVVQSLDLAAPRTTAIGTAQPAKGREVRKEKKTMARKWLELSPWHSKEKEKEEVHAIVGGEKADSQPSAPMRSVTPQLKTVSGGVGDEGGANNQAELLPMEDIYRAAGIMNPRKGYSVTKVIEMLQSQHIRDLSIELKRAAVLMALDAAGVSIEQVQEDAKTRQGAIDCYEAEQKQLVEAEWARKREENVQLESDLVRVKAHYTARISRNLERVALEKSAFESWLATKKQETVAMQEAVALCVKSAAPETPAAPLAIAVAAGAKPL